MSFPHLLKRSMDMLGAGVLLVLCAPLMIIIALCIKHDGGPALFSHMRIGCGGKSFLCFKFRSMAVDADQALEKYLERSPEAAREWHETQKLRHDPRITSIGSFLRRTSLDELPQLFNVIRGEMSLVGPRPIVAAEIARYGNDIEHYYRVRPGITGLWQVSGRNNIPYEQRVQMDSWYAHNWSLAQDLAILCKTLPAVLKGGGAY